MANITTNTDVDYLSKDFNSVVDALVSFATINYGANTSANRLWTNFNVDSFSRNWLELVAYIADIFFFYLDTQATEAYLQTATLDSAIKDIAKQFGFTPASATSASGIATFTVNGAGTITRGFRVSATNGEAFYLTNDIVVLSAGEVTGTVLQGTIVNEQFTAQGLQNEEFDLQGPNVVVDLTNLNSLDISPQVTVNGNSYTLVDSTINSNGTDTAAVLNSLGEVIGGGGRVFTLNTKADGTPYITFGDGVFGRKLLAGELVTIEYRSGGGSAGNIAKQSLTTLVDSNPIVTAVTNASDFSGGNDEQTIDQLRALIPASLRTLDRAVSLQDYPDLLVTNFSQVFIASADLSNTTGIDLNVYVVPQGNGITNITDNPTLLASLNTFLDTRKTVTTQFQILDAYGVSALFTLQVYLTNTASRTTVLQAIQTAIIDFFNLSTGGASGTGIGFAENILIKDLMNSISSISGIDHYEFTRFTYRPRLDYQVVSLVTSYINSEVSIFSNVSKSEWMLAANGADSFRCYKKILATVSNFSVDSITDNNLDLSVLNSTGTALSATVLLDNSQVFIANQYSTGAYYLVDAASNIWNISSNTSDSIIITGAAINNGSITALTSGPYSIVKNLAGYNILFKGSILPVQYNNKNTLISVGGEFNNIGTLGDDFEISKVQTNTGTFGVPVSVLSYTAGTGVIQFNGAPDLSTVDTTYNFIDNTGQIFNITAVDNILKTITVSSNLTPSLSPSTTTDSTVSKRYYDDSNEVSFILGLSNGVVTYATDVNDYGIGTVSGNPNKAVDKFVFRTSTYNDDITNLRANEIPQVSTSDIIINPFGGVS